MKRWICLLLLSLLLLGCARQEATEPTTVPTTVMPVTEPQEETEPTTAPTTIPVQTETVVPVTEPPEKTEPPTESSTEPSTVPVETEPVMLVVEPLEVSLDRLSHIEFYFSSGAGAWGTELHISPDGSFSGNHHDSNMGETGEGYPNGSEYCCDFTGRFSPLKKINAHTYSLRIEDLQYAKTPGTEEIREGVRYAYTTAFGLTKTEEMVLYLPGTPLEEIPEGFRDWLWFTTLFSYKGTVLPHYGLYNPEGEYGFTGWYIEGEAEEAVQCAEEFSAELDVWLETNFTQADMNQAAKERYRIWDDFLNSLWRVLLDVLPKDTMDPLTREQLAWIEEKEAVLADAGTQVEDGSIYPAVVSGTAARLTRERVYELLEYLPE